jgi:putative acetyltransferase
MTTFILRDALPGDEPHVRHVVFSVLREYGLEPDPGGTDTDLDDLASSYAARGGVFRVVLDGAGSIVGCGGLYPLNAEEAEVRKMYLLPTTRGHGLGRTLLEQLIGVARERGFSRVVLETASVLKEAIALYRRFGFVETCRPHLAGRCDQAFALELRGGAAQDGPPPPCGGPRAAQDVPSSRQDDPDQTSR